jgi:hypothetical protein
MTKMENVEKNIRKYVYSVLSDSNLDWSSKKTRSLGRQSITYHSSKIDFIEDDMIRVRNYKISLFEIGFTKLELYFPYFGVYSRLQRLTKKSEKKMEKQAADLSLKMVWNHIKETDKSFVRDNRLDELGIK